MIANLFKDSAMRIGFIKASLQAGDSPDKIQNSLAFYGYSI
jgi:hypothetical protein